MPRARLQARAHRAAVWRRDGKESLYFAPDNKAMSVEVSNTAAFKTSVPTALFAPPVAGGTGFNGRYRDVVARRTELPD